MLLNIRVVRALWLAPLGVFALLLVACGDEEIETYSVPKGTENIGGVTASVSASEDHHDHDHHDHSHDHGHAAAPTGADHGTGWTVPEGWREYPDNPPMRLATFLADGPSGEVEIAITRFPGDVGGRLANVNRWRGQIGLAPVGEAELEELMETFETPGFDCYFVHLHGNATNMIAVGLHERAADQTWFVRLVADEATTGHLEAEILDFARSFGTGGTGASGGGY